LKRSEHRNLAAGAAPAAAAADGHGGRRRSAAMASLLANAPVPLVLLAVALLGHALVTPETIGAYQMEMVMQVGVAIVMAVSLQLINGFSGQFSLGHAGFMAVGAYLSGYPSVAHSDGLANPAAVLLFYAALFVSVGIAAAALFGVFVAARRSGRLHPSLPSLLMVLIFAYVVFDFWRASRFDAPPAYLVVSRGVGLLQRLFDVIVTGGAGAADAASGALPEALRAPLCFLVLLAGGGLCAAGAGLVVGLPSLRLRGDYLAIATLGFAEIIRVAIQNAEPLGGPLGLGGIPTYTSFAWLYGAAVVTTLVIWRIAYSDKGRAIQAVREDEVAAASIGVDPTRHKVLSFVIGSFFAGVGGVLYAHFNGFITPQPTEFGLIRSIEFVVMVTLGGLGSISGAILAAVVLTVLPEVLRNVSSDVVEWRMVIYALLLIVMMLLRPQGLLGGRELWPRGLRGRRRGPAAKHAPPASPVDDDAPEPETKAL
jgi:branched-chain amino acid transport system permease protein